MKEMLDLLQRSLVDFRSQDALKKRIIGITGITQQCNRDREFLEQQVKRYIKQYSQKYVEKE